MLNYSAPSNDQPAKDFQSRAYEAGSMSVTIICPLCGISRTAAIEEMLQWRTEHQCRPPRPQPNVVRFPSRFSGKQTRK